MRFSCKVFIEQHLAVCRGTEFYKPTGVESNHPSSNFKPYGQGPDFCRQFCTPVSTNTYPYAQNYYPHDMSHTGAKLKKFESKGPSFHQSVSVSSSNRSIVPPKSLDIGNNGSSFQSDLPDLSVKPDTQCLARESDRLLLTDYYYYMMQQLLPCKFTERDRKTRGGKRDNIPIGYGGIMCRHCCNRPTARKFYWSDVDRVANSFAEIPTHMLKCKRCPANVKKNLLTFKSMHKEQMSRTPRGSQKVFFRRLWRRIHEDQATLSISGSPRAAFETDGKVLLYIDEDKEWLSDLDCFIRSNVEVFVTDDEDVDYFKCSSKDLVLRGNVGLRCVHCSHLKREDRLQGACFFPKTIGSIYESTRDFQKNHLPNCPHMLDSAKEKLNNTTASLTSVLRRYYILAAKALGMVDTQDGIKAAEGSKIDPNLSIPDSSEE